MLACYTYAVMRLLWTSLGYCATMSQVAQMLPGGMRCVTRGIAHFRHVPMKHSSYLLCLDLTAEQLKLSQSCLICWDFVLMFGRP
jgi:hypothetical protein